MRDNRARCPVPTLDDQHCEKQAQANIEKPVETRPMEATRRRSLVKDKPLLALSPLFLSLVIGVAYDHATRSQREPLIIIRMGGQSGAWDVTWHDITHRAGRLRRRPGLWSSRARLPG
jgi:hypothetical protein